MGNKTIIEVASLLSLHFKTQISLVDVAKKMGVSRQYLHKIKDKSLNDEQIEKIEKAFSFKFDDDAKLAEEIGMPEKIAEETKEKALTIPYWDDCELNKEKIINPCFSELQVDLQKIIHVYKANYENLRVIAMPGDEMDGGATPLRNNDMLLIDISINDTSSTGVYFCRNNSSIFVRRIVELVGEGIYISVDNPIYADILNGKMSYKELEEVGFKVIGKVIGNESWRM
jgi:predicted DNA-binding protein YlxM (UPF0122 family)